MASGYEVWHDFRDGMGGLSAIDMRDNSTAELSFNGFPINVNGFPIHFNG